MTPAGPPAHPRRGPPGRAERLLPLLPPALLPCAQRRCARSEVKTFGGERCFRPKARRGTARSAGASFPIDWGGLGKSCPRCGLAELRGRSKDGARGGTGHLRPRARARRGPQALNLPQPPSGRRALRLKQRTSRASPAPAALKSIFSHSFPSPRRVWQFGDGPNAQRGWDLSGSFPSPVPLGAGQPRSVPRLFLRLQFHILAVRLQRVLAGGRGELRARPAEG